MTSYRWNASSFAEGYDASAAFIHPYYDELQDAILALLPLSPDSTETVVDLGGGSGRLGEKILARFPQSRVVVIDQSEAFLALAERRMARFGDRGRCVLSRLQEDWSSSLDTSPKALVSMSAIHHLEPTEKQTLYQRCFDVLAPGGVLLNGDEVRPAADADYLALLRRWGDHMQRLMRERQVPESTDTILHQWLARNIDRFGEPRKSGDDCLETVEAQLGYYRQAGFSAADCPWQQELWGILRGNK
jgi:tRNA (cmo5U34)-methyltransferase